MHMNSNTETTTDHRRYCCIQRHHCMCFWNSRCCLLSFNRVNAVDFCPINMDIGSQCHWNAMFRFVKRLTANI